MTGLSKSLWQKPDKVWGKSKKKEEINAAFTTRHGALSLDLAVVSAEDPLVPPQTKVPARIVISTRHGRMDIDIVSPHFTTRLRPPS